MTDLRTVITESKRLRLTTWLATDVDDLHLLHSDPLVMKQMASGTITRSCTQERLQTWLIEHAARGWSKWRVEDRTGQFVGRAGFSQAHHTRHREIGYLLAPERWGFGYATELVATLAHWHFTHPDKQLEPNLLAYVFPENYASRRVLEKNAFFLLGERSDAPEELIYSRTN